MHDNTTWNSPYAGNPLPKTKFCRWQRPTNADDDVVLHIGRSLPTTTTVVVGGDEYNADDNNLLSGLISSIKKNQGPPFAGGCNIVVGIGSAKLIEPSSIPLSVCFHFEIETLDQTIEGFRHRPPRPIVLFSCLYSPLLPPPSSSRGQLQPPSSILHASRLPPPSSPPSWSPPPVSSPG